MKKRSVFFNCIAVPFFVAIVCMVLIVVFHLIPVRNFVMRLLGSLIMRQGNPTMVYYNIANIVALLPCMLFCCRSALKSKQAKKVITAVVLAVLISVAFGFGSNYILSMVDSIFRLTAWGLVLNFFVALAALIIFNMFFTEEFKEAKETYEAMEKSRKEAELQARMTVFMNSPAARNQVMHDAVAYKGKSQRNSAIKGAVIGGAVAGPAGAVVGAIAGKNKAEQKANSPVMDPAMQAVAYKKDDGTKTIVKDAIIGGAVAGPAGAVVGAVVGKNKVDQEK